MTVSIAFDSPPRSGKARIIGMDPAGGAGVVLNFDDGHSVYCDASRLNLGPDSFGTDFEYSHGVRGANLNITSSAGVVYPTNFENSTIGRRFGDYRL